MSDATAALPTEMLEGLAAGRLVPYLGPALLTASESANRPPAEPLALVGELTARTSVPGKIKHRLTQAAQFIENFKHRKTLVNAMDAAFVRPATPGALHRWIAALHAPLVVHAWYDDALRRAIAEAGDDFSEIQALAQSEHFGTWTRAYGSSGEPLDAPSARIGQAGHTLLYRPIGGHAPASNYLVSDSDFVEVLTEIDIQTPIPAAVQQLRATRGFVFIGCRFDDQLTRSFARQIMKRSAGPHFALLPDELTRMEARFLEEQGIRRVAIGLDALAAEVGGVAAAGA
jgi:hypothetical protein